MSVIAETSPTFFWRLIYGTPGIGRPVEIRYDLLLVFLSLMVAVLAGFAVIQTIDRVRASRDRLIRGTWLAVGAFVLGTGIWAMHFTGMLAMSIPGELKFDLLYTLLSAVPAIVAGGFVVWWVQDTDLTWQRINDSALMLTVGLLSMHYIGMEAVHAKAVLLQHRDLRIFTFPALSSFPPGPLRSQTNRAVVRFRVLPLGIGSFARSR